MKAEDAAQGGAARSAFWRDRWLVVPHQVIFRDLDFFGHVNNAVYFTYFEWARAVYWFEVTGARGPSGISFIVAHASCDFKEQIGLEQIEIGVRIASMRNSSMVFASEIRKSGGQLAATGTVVVVMYDWNARSKMRIPDDLRRSIEVHAGASSDSSGNGKTEISGDRAAS